MAVILHMTRAAYTLFVTEAERLADQ
jgi:hypothetical protein